MSKIGVSLGIIFLFVVSSVTPMVFGHNDRTTEEQIVEDYTFDRFDKFCFPENYFPENHMISVQSDYIKLELSTDSKETTNPPLIKKEKEELSSMLTSDGPMDSPWPMYCHDARHTGRSPYSTADNPGNERWWLKLRGIVLADDSPVVDNEGVIYVPSMDLYAIYPNGTLKWQYEVPGWLDFMCPAIAEDGTIYVGTYSASTKYLYAFNPDGTVKWREDIGYIHSKPAIGEDGTIYFGQDRLDKGYITAYYPNGTLRWEYYTSNNVIYSSPAIGFDGTIYCGSHDEYIYAIYPNGTLKWKYKTEDWIHGSPTIGDNGIIYCGSDDEYLYALYPNNGTLKWRCKIGSVWGAPTLGEDGTLYVGVWQKKFYAINPNGTIKWTYNAPGRIWFSSAALSEDGIIFFGTTSDIDGGKGRLIALNIDGTERWIQGNGDFESAPIIGEDGTVYIRCNKGDDSYLQAFGIGSLEADANGPYYGLINEPVQFTGSASGGYSPYSFQWDFGDTHSSEEQNPTHIYTSPGNYNVVLTVTDNKQNKATDTTYAWIQTSNEPPNKPTINGPTSGKPGISYDYTFSATDPDETPIYLYIDWDDGEIEEWIGPYASGEQVIRSHTWSEQGRFTIRCKAKDLYKEEGLWETFSVIMPRNKIISNSLFIRFLEQFPILQKLLLLIN